MYTKCCILMENAVSYNLVQFDGIITHFRQKDPLPDCYTVWHPVTVKSGFLSVMPFYWSAQVSTCMWTPLTLKASRRWPSWCLRWPQCPCRAAWASSTSRITLRTICSPSSAGIRLDNIRSCGEPIYLETSTWTGVQKPGSGYLYKWTWKLHILLR